MKEKKKMSKATKQLFALAFTLVLLIAGSYAWLTLQVTGNKTNILRAGTLKLTLDDTTSNGILLEKAVPMSDTKGKTTTEYTFTLQNTGTAVGYTIYLDDVALTDGETQLEDSKVKYQLTKNGEETVALLSSLDNKVIDTGTLGTNKTNTYSLRVWIDSDAGNEVMGKILSKELRVEATQTNQHTNYFATDSWATIAANVKVGNISTYQVGDTKEIDMGDLGTHTVRVANTSECTNGETSQTACGFVVEFADIISNHQMNSTGASVGGWPASEMRAYVNSTVYNALPSELQNVIATTTVVSGHGPTSGEANFTSSDKLYLLSSQEVWGGNNSYDTANATTRQLDYYKNKGVTTSNNSGTIKQYNGSNWYWWLRSANSYRDGYFFSVDSGGGWYDFYANNGRGVAPAFRIA